MKNVYLVAQEFKWESNCGALARVAANFGVKNLIFIAPKCKHNGKEALKYSKHAKGLLQKSKTIKDFEMLNKKFDYVVGTTSMLGTDYNVPRSPLNPEKLSEIVQKSGKRKIAVLIGREGEGLSNEEIRQCDFVVSIPASKKYPTLNVSHAAGIILYEIFKKSKEDKIGDEIKPAGKKQKDALLKLVNQKIKSMDFKTEQNKQTQKVIWKRVIGKALLTKREVQALFGFFKKFK